MKIAIYARVSTKDGKQDTENQLRELREFAARSGWEVGKEYIDHESAKTADRGAFQAMLTDAGKRKFDAVLCWALDRFTREGIEATFGYVRLLKTEGVDFISYSEPHFRTTGPAGELMLAIAAWIAKQERVRISDRTKAGLRTARAKGKTLGRRPVAVPAARVLELRAQGKGPLSIEAALRADGWTGSRGSIRRFLVARGESKIVRRPGRAESI